MILHFFEAIVAFGTDKSIGISAVPCVGQETMLGLRSPTSHLAAIVYMKSWFDEASGGKNLPLTSFLETDDFSARCFRAAKRI